MKLNSLFRYSSTHQSRPESTLQVTLLVTQVLREVLTPLSLEWNLTGKIILLDVQDGAIGRWFISMGCEKSLLATSTPKVHLYRRRQRKFCLIAMPSSIFSCCQCDARVSILEFLISNTLLT